MIKGTLLFLMACMGYFGYLKPYSPELFLFFWAIFAVFAVIYIVYFGIIAKPEMSVYAYFILWCLFPKGAIPKGSLLSAMNLPYWTGISLYSMIEIPAVTALLLAILIQRKDRVPNAVKGFYLLFAAAAALSVIVAFMTPIPLNSFDIPDVAIRYLGLTPLVYSLVFFTGCVLFIKTRVQIDRFFAVFVFAGGLLSAEFTLLKVLGLFPVLHHYAFHETERFKSLFFNEYMGVGLFAMFAALSALYFFFRHRKWGTLALFPFLCIPLFMVHERAHVIAFILTITVFLFLAIKPGRSKMALMVLMVSAVLALFFFGASVVEKIGSLLGGNVRDDYFSSDTGFLRVGVYFRAAEVIIYSFPFGVGPGGATFFMASSVVPANPVINQLIFNEGVANGYNRLTDGYVTGPHNLYLKFAAEYGLAGIIALLFFASYMVSMFGRFIRRARRLPGRYLNAAYLAQAASYSLFFGISGFYFLTHDPLYYLPFFLFAWLAFALPDEEGRGVLYSGKALYPEKEERLSEARV